MFLLRSRKIREYVYFVFSDFPSGEILGEEKGRAFRPYLFFPHKLLTTL